MLWVERQQRVQVYTNLHNTGVNGASSCTPKYSMSPTMMKCPDSFKIPISKCFENLGDSGHTSVGKIPSSLLN